MKNMLNSLQEYLYDLVFRSYDMTLKFELNLHVVCCCFVELH